MYLCITIEKNMLMKLIIALATLFLASVLSIDAKKNNIKDLLPDGSTLTENVTYKSTPQGDLKLDIYLPHSQKSQKVPVIVYIHGGSWMHGNKDEITYKFIGQNLKTILTEGYALVSIDYRLINEKGTVRLPEPLADCKDAIKWVKLNAEKYNFNTSKMAVMGSSAGAHLSMMAAYAPDDIAPGESALSQYDSKVNCVVDIYGPTNMAKILKAGFTKPAISLASLILPKKMLKMRNTLITAYTQENAAHPRKRKKKCMVYSPLSYVDNAVPTIVFHGTKDTLVPFKHTSWLEKKMKKQNKYLEVHPLEGENHVFPTITPEKTKEMCQQLAIFLRTYLN